MPIAECLPRSGKKKKIERERGIIKVFALDYFENSFWPMPFFCTVRVQDVLIDHVVEDKHTTGMDTNVTSCPFSIRREDCDIFPYPRLTSG